VITNCIMKKQLRMTHQREIILKELQVAPFHPTADELFARIKTKLPRISLATVYRNLEILSEANLVKKIAISGRQKRFDWDIESHSHVYCIECQRVDNIIPNPKVDFDAISPNNIGYKISGCRIEYFGLCPNCERLTKK